LNFDAFKGVALKNPTRGCRPLTLPTFLKKSGQKTFEILEITNYFPIERSEPLKFLSNFFQKVCGGLGAKPPSRIVKGGSP